MKSVVVLLVLGVFSATASAQAIDPSSRLRFSDRGRFMVAGSIDGYWSNDEAVYGRRTFADWQVGVWPSVTYFVMDRFGVGLAGGGGLSTHSWPRQRREEAYAGVAVRVLYDVALSERIGVVPVLSVGWTTTWTEDAVESSSVSPTVAGSIDGARTVLDYRRDVLRSTIFLPVTFAPSSNVVLGFGPELLFDRARTRSEGLGSFITSSAPGGTIQRVPSSVTDEPVHRVRVGAATWIGVSF